MSKRGEAIYHRKDGWWEARYVKEIDIFGKKKLGSVYGRTYKEAKEKRQDALDRMLLLQKNVPIRKITVEHLANEWLFVNKERVKPSTLQRYQGFMKNHIIPVIGHVSLVYINTASVHEFALNRVRAGLAPQSVNSILVFLHSCLKYGHRQYGFNMPDIIYLSPIKKEMRVLSTDEQRKLIAYLTDDMDIYKFGVLLTLYTGLRLGELCALRWEDIEPDCIRVRKTMQRLQKEDGSGTELHIGAPKTGSSIRVIPIPSFLKESLEAFREAAQGREYFLAKKGMPIAEPRVMQYKFRIFLKEAGIEKANFHCLRHSFATTAVARGFELKSLSEVLGHANIQTTLQRYVHSSFELKQINMERLSLLV